MATRYDRIPVIEVTGEVTAKALLEAINPVIAEVNAVLAELGTAEAETRGDDSRIPQFRAAPDLNKNRITNGDRSRDPGDFVIRQELMDLGLLGNPGGPVLNNVTLGAGVTITGASGGSTQIATADDVEQVATAVTGAIPVAVEGQRINGRDYGLNGTTQGTLLMGRDGDGRAQFLQSENGRLLLDTSDIGLLLLEILRELRRLNGVDD